MSSTKPNTPFFTTDVFAKVTKASDDNAEAAKLVSLIKNANEYRQTTFFDTNLMAKQKTLNKLNLEYRDYILSKDYPQFTSAAIAVTVEYYNNDLRRINKALDDWIRPASGRAVGEGGKLRTSKSARVNGSGKGGEGGRYVSTKENSSNGSIDTSQRVGGFSIGSSGLSDPNSRRGKLNRRQQPNYTTPSSNNGQHQQSPTFTNGTLVILQNCQDKSLNDKKCKITNFDSASGRYEVEFVYRSRSHKQGVIWVTLGMFRLAPGNMHAVPVSTATGYTTAATPSTVPRAEPKPSTTNEVSDTATSTATRDTTAATSPSIPSTVPEPSSEPMATLDETDVKALCEIMGCLSTLDQARSVLSRFKSVKDATIWWQSRQSRIIDEVATVESTVGDSVLDEELTTEDLQVRIIAYMQEEDWAGVIACSNKRLETNPNDIEALTTRGSAYQSSNDFVNAMEDFDKAISLNPPEHMLPDLHERLDQCILPQFIAFVTAQGPFPKIPSTWETWSHNKTLVELQSKFEVTPRLIDVAEQHEREQVPSLFYGKILASAKIVALAHFPVEKEGAHLGYPGGVENSYCPNKSIRQLFFRLEMILSIFFNIPSSIGLPFLKQKVVVFNVLAIDGPPRQADDTEENKTDFEKYEKIWEESEELMVEYVTESFKLVPNAELVIVYSEKALAFLHTHPDIIPKNVKVVNYDIHSPHPCKWDSGFIHKLHPTEGRRSVDHGVQLFELLFGMAPGTIKITSAEFNRYCGDRLNSSSRFGYELWENIPGEGGTLLMRIYGPYKTMMKPQIPVDYVKTQFVEGLKVGEYNKIDLGSSIVKGYNKQEYSNLYVKKIEFSDNAGDFKKPGVFPFTNVNTVGKENKANQGGLPSKAVALHLEVSDGEGSYIIEESNRVVQVGSPKHACALIGRGSGSLNGLVKGEKRRITAKTKEQNQNDPPEGADLIAVLATEFDEGPSTSSSPRFGGRSEGEGPKFDSISSSFADRLVPDHLYTQSLSKDALAAINKHHTENSEWKKYSELPTDGDVKDEGKKKKKTKKKKTKKKKGR